MATCSLMKPKAKLARQVRMKLPVLAMSILVQIRNAGRNKAVNFLKDFSNKSGRKLNETRYSQAARAAQ